MKIKLLVMDVDGTLTDGNIFTGSNGEVMKSFYVRDGYGIIHLSDYGITPVIITGKSSQIVAHRAQELKISEIHQGISDKLACLKSIAERYNVIPGEIAYIGDDVNDIECIRYCGITACPGDAHDDVIPTVDYVCRHNGGNGAVREFIDNLVNIQIHNANHELKTE